MQHPWMLEQMAYEHRRDLLAAADRWRLSSRRRTRPADSQSMVQPAQSMVQPAQSMVQPAQSMVHPGGPTVRLGADADEKAQLAASSAASNSGSRRMWTLLLRAPRKRMADATATNVTTAPAKYAC